ncbi:hypothetical protein DLM86_07460 [Paenibacillus flagellatus]|uniref:Uncharacterized protein n=1 Tax=Paenibacillus flagellatus TaxID=2211139 RepID=A0A2V5K7X8_9BACL|nr:hypothetical protein DLM86_07460 [Paenibacillus flagellatus]
MRYLKWSLISVSCYSILTVLAWFIDDLGWKKGITEGSYQIVANFVSNLQFLFKMLIGSDDVLNYHFRLLPFLMGAVVWIGIAVVLCSRRGRAVH